MARDNECDVAPSEPRSLVCQGDRSNAYVEVKVSHDLGDRTAILLLMLGLVIAAGTYQIGLDHAERQQQSRYMLELSTKMQIAINHKVAQEEKEDAKQSR